MSAVSEIPSSGTFSTHEKAQKINLDNSFYGTFAEIGAGQEAARWFFRVGGASGTVAKSMSAYDMTFSDAIYGPADRYVSQERLLEMLEHEYYLLRERLALKRGSSTRFFVFANTVVAKGYSTPRDTHAWTGLNLQMRPDGPVNQLVLHYRLLDSESIAQQEAIGIMGVNLIYAGYMYWDNLDLLLKSLKDNIAPERIEIDMFRMSGPDLETHDNRVASLKMVQNGISNAALFSPDGNILQPSDTFYKKSILLERGYFRPVTKVNIDMMEKGRARFLQEPMIEGSRPIEVMEITMRNLLATGSLDPKDFLARVDCIGAMNKYVLISDIGEFYKLQHYLERYTQHMIGIVIGQPLLREIFNEKYYEDLPGGILESFGRLFKNRLRVYVYPSVEETSGRPLTAEDMELPSHLHHLHMHLMTNKYIVDLPSPAKPLPYHPSKIISDKIRNGDETWIDFVPPKVVELIKNRGYFGFGSELH
jgi:hypothetical protein